MVKLNGAHFHLAIFTILILTGIVYHYHSIESSKILSRGACNLSYTSFQYFCFIILCHSTLLDNLSKIINNKQYKLVMYLSELSRDKCHKFSSFSNICCTIDRSSWLEIIAKGIYYDLNSITNIYLTI